ncbi:hypothetical protein ACFOY2_00750 [Nonomuraea purpurea]|uniref:Uncharacterized protein n=1 Tax=Nonomuraea purpurea TaxID=1849276 RepID=A0ABV8FYG0_9ACTN
MLNVNPKMLDRLKEIETDLLASRERAEADGWISEVEGIDLTRSAMRVDQASGGVGRQGETESRRRLTRSEIRP